MNEGRYATTITKALHISEVYSMHIPELWKLGLNPLRIVTIISDWAMLRLHILSQWDTEHA